jgi:hypothetical protein
MSEKFLKGALIEFKPLFGPPVPNVILFQFNPETMTHTWTQPEPTGGEGVPTSGGARTNALAVQGLPGESFTFSIAMDARETIADGGPMGPAAETSGVYTRLAALEMLQYPVPAPDRGLVGSVTASGTAGASIGGALGGGQARRRVPQNQLPTVLFVWGPGRIVPVRVTALSITEQLYDGLLNPTSATANLTLRVLTPNELEWVTGPLKDIANGAYDYSQALRKVLAVANLGNARDSITGMLPI